MDKITLKKLNSYINITKKAFRIAKKASFKKKFKKERDDFLGMIECYIKDAIYFKNKKEFVNAFAAISYAHGWLDAGARLSLFKVNDSKLFTVD